MVDTSRASRTPHRLIHISIMLFLVVFGVFIGIAVAVVTKDSYPEISKLFAGGAVTLLFGALLGGVVSQLIAEFDRRRLQRAAQLDFMANVLSDLKGVYDAVDSGRTLIRAHQSAKTYGEQMRSFIDARVKLLTVVRALVADERGKQMKAVRDHVISMEEYLKDLTSEFEEKYKGLSRLQRLHEARMETAVKNAALDPQKTLETPWKEPWDEIKELRRLKDLMRAVGNKADSAGDVSDYEKRFLGHLDAASEELRRALRNEL